MNANWNDVVQAAIETKEAEWKEVLGARDEDAKDRCMEVYKTTKKKRERLKGVFLRANRR